MSKTAERCPRILPTLVMGNDPELLAQASCVLARRGYYLPVVDGPRMGRPDRSSEIVRRNNVAARIKAKSIVFAGLDVDTCDAFKSHFRASMTTRVTTVSDVVGLKSSGPRFEQALQWGHDRIGLGLLKALREKRQIVFTMPESPQESVPSISGHLVVCEDRDELAQVIAANYAFSLGAGLCLIPTVDEEDAKLLLERFYGLYEDNSRSASEILIGLRSQLRTLAGQLPIIAGQSVTFVSGLPYGFAFPEVPSTHLFAYPDLGIAVVNGFAAEQPDTPGIGVAVLVDPQRAEAPEMRAAERLLPERLIFVRGYRGRGASVHEITRMMELFPYDLLLIATHCGDASGWRWTYEFVDSENIARRFVVDTAIGVGDPHPEEDDDDRLLDVTQFYRFVSLDGVDWTDRKAKKDLYVGQAVLDWSRRLRDDDFEPVGKTPITRVIGSAALQMFDHNLIAVPTSIGGHGTPVVVNNACGSWHRLAASFTFGNARAYIGTLFMVGTSEAEAFAIKLLGKHFGKPLGVALWLAQNEIYGDAPRRPYVVTGVHPQRLRSRRQDAPREILKKLLAELGAHQRMQKEDPGAGNAAKRLADRVAYLKGEVRWFKDKWFGNTGRS